MKRIMILKTKLNFIPFLVLLTGICMVLTIGCEKDSSEYEELKSGTVTDIDGNVYKTVKIGSQIWMAENLKTTQYRNGDPIPEVTDNDEWGDLTTGAYCNHDNNSANVSIYGRLYNWYAVNDSRNLAPTGWHIPTDAEFATLKDYLGGFDVAGGKLKETGTTHWESPNLGATNEYAFNALPVGARGINGIYFTIGDISIWWSADQYSEIYGYYWHVHSEDAALSHHDNPKVMGYSVRCVKD